jgi:hypothetical protein
VRISTSILFNNRGNARSDGRSNGHSDDRSDERDDGDSRCNGLLQSLPVVQALP